ncbi:MAG TPA: hypothetical protein VKT76_14735, partial [Bradyrhizobium sp.]|nr:hypothetical protein [Bradyrhizobium sp.]
ALTGIANHAAKSAVDIATLSLGFNPQMQLIRFKPVSPVIEREWRQLQEGLKIFSSDVEGNAR